MSAKPNRPELRVKELIEATFQLDRLEKLAMGSVFLRVAYAELIGNLNYAMIHEECETLGTETITIANIAYPLTLKGRKAAMAESFRHFSNKLDDFLSAANVSTILGSMDLVKDIASSALSGSRVSQTVKP